MNRVIRVASLGLGWWAQVLADAVSRIPQIEIAACHSPVEAERQAFSGKYGCRAVRSYEDILADDSIDAILNATPNNAHLETTRQAALAGKHVFLEKPIANTVAEGLEIARIARDCGVVLAVGYQRRRESHFRWIRSQIEQGHFGRLVQAECNISRDRLGKIDPSSWRFRADGMPGGVMLQIGVHYVDVLEMLMGPVTSVMAMASQLVLAGENPDVASMLLKHEGGALSTLSSSYASASEYYMMNVYGKEASAYFDMFGGLHHLRRGDSRATAVALQANDTCVEQLGEFARCIQQGLAPEVGAEQAVRSLAVIRAGIRSAGLGRAVDVAEMLAVPMPMLIDEE